MTKSKPKYKMSGELSDLVNGFSTNLHAIDRVRKADSAEPMPVEVADDVHSWTVTAKPNDVLGHVQFFNGQMGNVFFDHYLPESDWGQYVGTFYDGLKDPEKVVALDYTAIHSNPADYDNEHTKGYVNLAYNRVSVDDLLSGDIKESDLNQMASHFMVPKLKIKDGKPVMDDKGKPVFEMDGDKPKFEVNPGFTNLVENFGGPNGESARSALAMKGRVYNIQREALLAEYRSDLEKDLVTGYEGGQAGLLKATAIQHAYQAAKGK